MAPSQAIRAASVSTLGFTGILPGNSSMYFTYIIYTNCESVLVLPIVISILSVFTWKNKIYF